MASLPLSRAAVPDLIWRDSCASTNSELLALATTETPSYTTLVTDDQTAGRGRLDRRWEAPAGSALAISVLVRPRLPSGRALGLDRFGWLPLAAGVAMVEAVAASIPASPLHAPPSVKWPNDVLVGGGKLAGVLSELLPTGEAVVVGVGLNLAMTGEQAPVPTATSLAMLGADVDAEVVDGVLAGYLARLRGYVDDYARHGGDAVRSGLRARALELCSTLGRSVLVELPDGERMTGTAVDLDADGRLLVARHADGRVAAVAAGDVTHLRYG